MRREIYIGIEPFALGGFADELTVCGGCRPIHELTRFVGTFIGFVDAAKKAKCSYYVNEDTHSKFIVSDNHVILTTCNFTPTQFIYIPRVEIEQFERMPDLSYSGIHCEIGAYFVVSSSGFADQVSEEFNKMIQLPRTQRMF